MDTVHQILMNEGTVFNRKDDKYMFFGIGTDDGFEVSVEEAAEHGNTTIRFTRFTSKSPTQQTTIDLGTVDDTTVQKYADDDSIQTLFLSFDLHFDFVSKFESSFLPKIDMFYLRLVEIKMTGKSEKAREETMKMLKLMENVKEVSLKFEYHYDDFPLPEILNHHRIDLWFDEVLPEPVLMNIIMEVLRLTHSEKGAVFCGNERKSLHQILIKRPEMVQRDDLSGIFFIESCDRAFQLWVHFGDGYNNSSMIYARCSAVWMDENREWMKRRTQQRSLVLEASSLSIDK